MNTLDAIAKRKSTRSYRPEQIPEEDLQKILRAGCAAPVGMARYDTLHITVVQNEEMLDRINTLTADVMEKVMGVRKNMDFGAKTLIFVSSMPGYRPGMECANTGIVVENMVLAATALGIDTVILGGAPVAVSQDAELVKALGIPEGFTPILGIFLGYGAEDTPVKEHSITINRI